MRVTVEDRICVLLSDVPREQMEYWTEMAMCGRGLVVRIPDGRKFVMYPDLSMGPTFNVDLGTESPHRQTRRTADLDLVDV